MPPTSALPRSGRSGDLRQSSRPLLKDMDDVIQDRIPPVPLLEFLGNGPGSPGGFPRQRPQAAATWSRSVLGFLQEAVELALRQTVRVSLTTHLHRHLAIHPFEPAI